MIEEKLEIILITYNRPKDLENTLKQLLKGPFVNCKFTVIDNCSTDETPEICLKYQQLFPKMRIIRNKLNIGANPNYLRAVETSNSLYTWILCDDDSFDFSDCLDVIDAIDSEKPDIIIVTSHFQQGWERGLFTSSRKLLKNGSRYYHTLSFWPAIIFKTDLYDSNCIHKGYFNVPNLYPHFEFINHSIEEDFKVYVSKKEIVKNIDEHHPGFPLLHSTVGWMNSCLLIKDKEIRKQTIYFKETYPEIIEYFCVIILIEKLNNRNIFNYIIQLKNAFILNFGLSKDLFILLLIYIFALAPAFCYELVLKAYMIKDKERTERFLKDIRGESSENKSIFRY
ncbi:MAG: glycosyltransferase family 2 protein [Methanobacterium sp.]|uniref:glycosyltransferase family 2 protein n=1 Tax=Methanobacterium sp. TaxID=2164 RepID=UPI003D648A60|nr:glycosyltransferase family 2 protein [Methanobacterium sp.]